MTKPVLNEISTMNWATGGPRPMSYAGNGHYGYGQPTAVDTNRRCDDLRRWVKSTTEEVIKLSDTVEKTEKAVQKQMADSSHILGEHMQTCETESAANDQRIQHVEDNGAQRERRITQLESENADLRQTVSKMEQLIEKLTTRVLKLEAKQKHDKAAFDAHLKHCDRSQRPREEHANPLTSPLTSDDEGESFLT